MIQYHNVDISNLLKKKYYQFWSQIVYDESLQNFLDSYLRFCERPYPPFSPTVSPNSIGQEDLACFYERDANQQNLFKRVYSVLARISNYEETTTLHMERKFFANLIYDKKLWDVPKILDVCVLYGPRNKEKTTKMVSRLFELQPKFNDDLSKLLPVIEKVIHGHNSIQKITTTANIIPPMVNWRKLATFAKIDNSSTIYLCATCTPYVMFLDSCIECALRTQCASRTDLSLLDAKPDNFLLSVFSSLSFAIQRRHSYI